MSDDRAPRITTREYYRCLERAAEASSAEEIRQLRDEVMRHWRGDPRADDLTEALYAHLVRVSEQTASNGRVPTAGFSGPAARTDVSTTRSG